MLNYKTRPPSRLPKRHQAIPVVPIVVDSALAFAILIGLVTLWRGPGPTFRGIFPLLRRGEELASPVKLIEGASTPAMIAMTYDAQAQARVDAISSIGAFGDITALPRLHLLQVTDGNERAQRAAHEAEYQLISRVAGQIHLPATSIRNIAVAPSNVAYLATIHDLYVNRDGSWQYVNPLPDSALSLAIAPDPDTLYLATAAAGLFVSQNAGVTWKYLAFGLHTPTQLTATSIVVDPIDSRRIYVALVTPGADKKQSPLGIFWTQDAGETWRYLENSPNQAVTSLLAIDSEQPAYLFGLADDTPWRYTLPKDPM